MLKSLLKKTGILSAAYISVFSLMLIFPKVTLAAVFEIHLFFDESNRTIKFDSKKTEPVSLNESEYISVLETVQRSETEHGEYATVLLNAKGGEIISLEFNPKPGSFDEVLPYFSLAKTLKIVKSADKSEILSADLTAFLACNGNGICEFEKKENNQTCLEDCGSSHVRFSPETTKQLEENDGIIRDEKTGDILLKDPAKNDTYIFPGSSGQTQEQPPTNQSNALKIIIGVLIFSAVIIVFVVVKILRK